MSGAVRTDIRQVLTDAASVLRQPRERRDQSKGTRGSQRLLSRIEWAGGHS